MSLTDLFLRKLDYKLDLLLRIMDYIWLIKVIQKPIWIVISLPIHLVVHITHLQHQLECLIAYVIVYFLPFIQILFYVNILIHFISFNLKIIFINSWKRFRLFLFLFLIQKLILPRKYFVMLSKIFKAINFIWAFHW